MRIAPEVLNVLGNAETEGDALRLTGQLDRKLYLRVNEVLEAAGGKWNRKAKAHIFDGDAAEIMELIILTGEVERTKTDNQIFGYFPTPEPVAQRVIELAEIAPGMTVLEPSAGRGALASKVPADATVECVEIQVSNAAELERMGFRTVADDFLSVDVKPLYDRVVMNPPFAKQADVRHVLHAHKALKRDGKLVSVMSAGIKFRDTKITQQLRELIDATGGCIEDVPEGAFKEAGTMVNTVIVVIPA